MQFGFVVIIESNPEQLVLLVWCSDLPSLPNCSGLLFRLEMYGKLLHTYLVQDFIRLFRVSVPAFPRCKSKGSAWPKGCRTLQTL